MHNSDNQDKEYQDTDPQEEARSDNSQVAKPEEPPLYPTVEQNSQPTDPNTMVRHITLPITTSEEETIQKLGITSTTNSSLLELQMLDLGNYDNNANLLDIADDGNISQYCRFLEGREIRIDDATEVIHEGYLTSYKLYTIRSKGRQGQKTTEVKRRFSDFEFQQQQLVENYSGHIIPVLPEKNFWASLNMEGNDYSDYRKKRLKKYVDSLLMDERFRLAPSLRLFLFDSSVEFAQRKGEFEEKTKIEDKFKMIAGRVFQVGRSFVSSLVSLKAPVDTKPSWAEHISKDNFQITEYCLKLKSLHETVDKLKKEVENRARQLDVLCQINYFLDEINIPNESLKFDLLGSFEDAEYYVLSCWQALQRHGKLHLQLQNLKGEEEGLSRKERDNPRSKEMDLVLTKIKRLSERVQKSSSTLQEQMKRGWHKAQYLCTSFLELYFYYRRGEYS